MKGIVFKSLLLVLFENVPEWNGRWRSKSSSKTLLITSNNSDAIKCLLKDIPE